MDASIFDPVLSHPRRSDALEKRGENSGSIFGRFRLWTSFESLPVSVKNKFFYCEDHLISSSFNFKIEPIPLKKRSRLADLS